jgi:CRP/FNR family transcriptional regulator
MDNSQIVEQIHMFAGLPPSERERVRMLLHRRHAARGELLLVEGGEAGPLCFVQSGLVKIFKTSFDGKEQILRLVSSLQTFNDVPAIDGRPNPASAAALQPSVIYQINHADMQRLIHSHPLVAEAVIQTLADALRHLVTLVEDLSFRHVTARVAKMLLSTRPLNTGPLTQSEMAAMTGTVREVIGRALKELESVGAITLQHGHIQIIDSERLQMLGANG